MFEAAGKITTFTLLLLLAQILVLPVRATTIVAVRTKKEIIIGADSKVTDTFGNAAANQACKIGQAGKVFFAYAGFARDQQTGFSVPEIAAQALDLEPSASISEKADRLARTIVEKLGVELPLLKRNSFVTYREKIEGKIFLRILIAGFEKGEPVLLVRQFRLGQTGDRAAGVIVSSDDCAADCPGKTATRFLGETDAIVGLPEETKDFWQPNLAAGVRRLIETQIAARDEYVGPPIDILRITRRRAVWIQKKPLCAAIKNYPK